MDDQNERTGGENRPSDLRDITSRDPLAGVDNVEVDWDREAGISERALSAVLTACNKRGESLLFLADDFGRRGRAARAASGPRLEAV